MTYKQELENDMATCNEQAWLRVGTMLPLGISDTENESDDEFGRNWQEAGDMVDTNFSWNDVDDAIDNGTINEMYEEDEYEKAKAVAREQRKESYKSTRDQIFSSKTIAEVNDIMDGLSDFELEPEPDFCYVGLWWAVNKRTEQLMQEDAWRRKQRQQAIVQKWQEQNERVVPAKEPFVPIIMRLHGTSTLKRVEEAHVYRALLKQGYEVIK